jgi:hypothetical protein
LLLSLLLDRLQHIAGFGDVRQVDLGLELIGWRAAAVAARNPRFAMLLVVLLDLLGFIDLDGTRVGLLFCNSDLSQNIEDHFTLHLEFPCQVIDSDFQLLHSARFPPICSVPAYAFIASSP